MGGACSIYGNRRGDTGFSWENLRETGHLKDPGLRWVDNIKKNLQKME
jgi:hypothetical protein